MSTRPTPEETVLLLEEAIRLFDGSETKLAKRAGFSQNALWHARRVGRVSGDLAAGIDRATKGLVSIRRTRPDLVATISATSSASPGDSSLRAGEPSDDPNSEIFESPQPVQGLGDRGAVPASEVSA